MARLGIVEGYGVTFCVTAPKRSALVSFRVERLGGEIAVARLGSFAGVAAAWEAACEACALVLGDKAAVSERAWKGTPDWALSAPYFVAGMLEGQRAVRTVRALLRAVEAGRDPGAEIAKASGQGEGAPGEVRGIAATLAKPAALAAGSPGLREPGLVEITSEPVRGLWTREGFGETETLVARFRRGTSRLARALSARA